MNDDYNKEVKLETAYEIIARLDDGLASEWIDKAIENLNNLKHVRDNVPF